jgi:hypothetical protein
MSLVTVVVRGMVGHEVTPRDLWRSKRDFGPLGAVRWMGQDRSVDGVACDASRKVL